MSRISSLWCFFLLSCLFLAGCGGNDSDFVFAGSPPTANMPIINPPDPVREFTLKPQVKVLDSATIVEGVTNGQVTLSGDTSAIVVGSVIVQSTGPNTFIRRVVSIDRSGATTVVTTEPATAADVFATADISQTDVVDPALMIPPDTTQAGLRMQAVAVSGRVSEELLNSSRALQIDFENFIINGDDGEPLAKLNGQMFAVTGFTTSLEIDAQGNQRAGNNPQTAVFGNVTVDFLSSNHGNVNARLAPARTVQLPPLAGVVPLTAKVELFFNFNGYGFRGSKFTFSSGRGPGLGSQISTSYGFDPKQGFGASSAEFSSQWTALTSALSGNQADFTFSPFSMRAFIAWPANPDNLGSLWTLNPLTFQGEPSGTNGYTVRQRSSATRFHCVMPAAFESFQARFGSLIESFRAEDRILAGIASNDNPQSRTGLISTNPPGPLRIGVGETVIVGVQTEGVLDYGRLQVLPRADGGLPAVSVGGTGSLAAEGTNIRIRGERVGTSIIQINHLRSDLNQTDLRVEVTEQPQTAAFTISRSLDPFDSPFFVPELETNHTYAFEATLGNRRVGKDAVWSVEGNSALLLGPGFIQTGGNGPLTVTATFQGRTATLRFNVVGSELVNLDIVSPSNNTLQIGSSRSLDAFASYIDGSRRRVTNLVKWSANPANQFGTVSDTGVVVGTSEGSLLATATLENQSTAQRIFIGLPKLTRIEILPANPQVGISQGVQLQARGTFADGSVRLLRGNEVLWQVPSTGSTAQRVGVNQDGVVGGISTGRDEVIVSSRSGGPVASTTVEVLGPNALSVPQSPTQVVPNSAFSVAVQAVGPGGSLEPGFNGTVTVRLGTNPAGGTLTGTVSAQAVNGVATFNDLRINNAGNGYTLVFSADALASAITSAFDVTAPTSGGGGLIVAGRLIVASNSSSAPSLGVAQYFSNGTVNSNPTLTPLDTAGRPYDIVRLGSRVYSLLGSPFDGPNQLLLDSRGYDSTNGTLDSSSNSTVVGNTTSLVGAYLATNNSDALFIANQNGRSLTAQVVDGSGGFVTNTQVAVTGAIPAEDSDLVDVAFRSGDVGEKQLVFTLSLLNQINVYSYSYTPPVAPAPAVPPVLTLEGRWDNRPTFSGTAVGPFITDGTNLGGSLLVVGDWLYVTNRVAGLDSITRYTIDPVNGTLSNRVVFPFGGSLSDPRGMRVVSYGAKGRVLFVANAEKSIGVNDPGTISAFEIDGNGDLSSAPADITTATTGGPVPKEFQEVTLPGGQRVLYVTLSNNRIEGFNIDEMTGRVNTPSLGTFGGYTNPFAITQ